MRIRTLLIATVALATLGLGVAPVADAAQPRSSAGAVAAGDTTPLRILVTNDDGVAAPGLAVLVDALQALPHVEVTVVAPATNQSGVGDKYSTTPITVAPATTANGDAATAVAGTPADSVLYAIQVAMPQPPHVVVSGTNFGQNLGDITSVSGTVGAARWANRLGVPAVAVSAGFGTDIAASYATGAAFAAGWLSYFRTTYLDETTVPRTLNVNVPTCGVGGLRGIRAEPLGRAQTISGYGLTSGVVGDGTFQPVVTSKGVLNQNIDCSTTATSFDSDIDAFNAGFISVTAINPDLTDQ
jgi:5'-nucleotidase